MAAEQRGLCPQPPKLFILSDYEVINPQDIDLVVSFVKVSLAQRLQDGDPATHMQYRMIVQQIKQRDDLDMLWKLLIALSRQSCEIIESGHAFKDLLDSIFYFNWDLPSKILKRKKFRNPPKDRSASAEDATTSGEEGARWDLSDDDDFDGDDEEEDEQEGRGEDEEEAYEAALARIEDAERAAVDEAARIAAIKEKRKLINLRAWAPVEADLEKYRCVCLAAAHLIYSLVAANATYTRHCLTALTKSCLRKRSAFYPPKVAVPHILSAYAVSYYLGDRLPATARQSTDAAVQHAASAEAGPEGQENAGPRERIVSMSDEGGEGGEGATAVSTTTTTAVMIAHSRSAASSPATTNASCIDNDMESESILKNTETAVSRFSVQPSSLSSVSSSASSSSVAVALASADAGTDSSSSNNSNGSSECVQIVSLNVVALLNDSITDSICRVVHSVLNLAPATAPAMLGEAVTRFFPHKRFDRDLQVAYATDVLRIISFRDSRLSHCGSRGVGLPGVVDHGVGMTVMTNERVERSAKKERKRNRKTKSGGWGGGIGIESSTAAPGHSVPQPMSMSMSMPVPAAVPMCVQQLRHRVVDTLLSRCLEMDVEIAIDEYGEASLSPNEERDQARDNPATAGAAASNSSNIRVIGTDTGTVTVSSNNNSNNSSSDHLDLASSRRMSSGGLKSSAVSAAVSRGGVGDPAVGEEEEAKNMYDNSNKIPKEVSILADKLDSLLFLLMQQYHTLLYGFAQPASSFSAAAAAAAFSTALSASTSSSFSSSSSSSPPPPISTFTASTVLPLLSTTAVSSCLFRLSTTPPSPARTPALAPVSAASSTSINTTSNNSTNTLATTTASSTNDNTMTDIDAGSEPTQQQQQQSTGGIDATAPTYSYVHGSSIAAYIGGTHAASSSSTSSSSSSLILSSLGIGDAVVGASQYELSDKAVLELLRAFEHRLLPTYKSKSVQFFLFFVAARSLHFARNLVEFLLTISIAPLPGFPPISSASSTEQSGQSIPRNVLGATTAAGSVEGVSSTAPRPCLSKKEAKEEAKRLKKLAKRLKKHKSSSFSAESIDLNAATHLFPVGLQTAKSIPNLTQFSALSGSTGQVLSATVPSTHTCTGLPGPVQQHKNARLATVGGALGASVNAQLAGFSSGGSRGAVGLDGVLRNGFLGGKELMQGAQAKRMAATMYLASFVSRAKFLPLDLVREVLDRLLGWANDYLTLNDHHKHGRNDGDGGGIRTTSSSSTTTIGAATGRRLRGGGGAGSDDVHQHDMFYCVVQAACYIACFYGSATFGNHGSERTEASRFFGSNGDLLSLQMPKSSKKTPTALFSGSFGHPLTQAEELKHAHFALLARWTRVLSSDLHPLAYCVRTVRKEFLKIGQLVGLFDAAFAARYKARNYRRKSDLSGKIAGGRCSMGLAGGTGGGAYALDSSDSERDSEEEEEESEVDDGEMQESEPELEGGRKQAREEGRMDLNDKDRGVSSHREGRVESVIGAPTARMSIDSALRMEIDPADMLPADGLAAGREIVRSGTTSSSMKAGTGGGISNGFGNGAGARSGVEVGVEIGIGAVLDRMRGAGLGEGFSADTTSVVTSSVRRSLSGGTLRERTLSARRAAASTSAGSMRKSAPFFGTTNCNAVVAAATVDEKGGEGAKVENLMKGRECNPFDSFFPFDPCLLVRTHQVIAQDYRFWEKTVVPPPSSTATSPTCSVRKGCKSSSKKSLLDDGALDLQLPLTGIGAGSGAGAWDAVLYGDLDASGSMMGESRCSSRDGEGRLEGELDEWRYARLSSGPYRQQHQSALDTDYSTHCSTTDADTALGDYEEEEDDDEDEDLVNLQRGKGSESQQQTPYFLTLSLQQQQNSGVVEEDEMNEREGEDYDEHQGMEHEIFDVQHEIFSPQAATQAHGVPARGFGFDFSAGAPYAPYLRNFQQQQQQQQQMQLLQFREVESGDDVRGVEDAKGGKGVGAKERERRYGRDTSFVVEGEDGDAREERGKSDGGEEEAEEEEIPAWQRRLEGKRSRQYSIGSTGSW